MTKYNFGEKKEEFANGANLQVWQSPKYIQSKEKAIELIEKGEYGLDEGDFWILMNKSKSGKMIYTGLIISHNGCLKINDKLENKLKFNPESVSFLKDEQEKVMQYINKEQGIYEFGELSPSNCKNQYPYAMVLKRLMDRVILKNSKVGFFGIYSEAESDEFKEKPEPKENKATSTAKKISKVVDNDMKEVMKESNLNTANIIKDKLMQATSKDDVEDICGDYKSDISKLYKHDTTLFNEVKELKDNLLTQLQ